MSNLTMKPFDVIMYGGVVLHLSVCKSNAGYYLGYFSRLIGPVDRVTQYMSKQDAEDMLSDILGNENITALYGVAGDEYTRERR